jgi:S-adenosylmethionine:tRNA ribosyltransferase-isomerase
VELKIKIQDFSYNLPDEKIAKYPLPDRDLSKILIFENNLISESKFRNLAELLKKNTLLVFNNTKVVPARLFFKKSSGANIEIFCLEPHLPEDYVRSFEATESCEWVCIVGNIKKWKEGFVYFNDYQQLTGDLNLKAEIVKKTDNNVVIRFSWNTGIPFSAVIEHCGKIPIPPYLNRDTEESDLERYQTVYALKRGSVAAPTAGLHFTDIVIDNLTKKGIEIEKICLHVGAGTFLPVKSEYIVDHKMHFEPFEITKSLLLKILQSLDNKDIVAVGTTSARTLESLYYLGVQCIRNGKPGFVEQWEPYKSQFEISTKDSIEALINWMDTMELSSFKTKTGIIIVPGFKFRIINRLITNFHQPQSTLLLLISAFIGSDWRRVYEYALSNNFRFLSYGDSSILTKNSFLNVID